MTAGADGVGQWQVFHRWAVGCVFDVAETGRFALRAGSGRIRVPEVFTAEYEVYAAWLSGRGLAESTVRSKTGLLRRFLAFLADSGGKRWKCSEPWTCPIMFVRWRQWPLPAVRANCVS